MSYTLWIEPDWFDVERMTLRIWRLPSGSHPIVLDDPQEALHHFVGVVVAAGCAVVLDHAHAMGFEQASRSWLWTVREGA